MQGLKLKGDFLVGVFEFSLEAKRFGLDWVLMGLLAWVGEVTVDCVVIGFLFLEVEVVAAYPPTPSPLSLIVSLLSPTPLTLSN